MNMASQRTATPDPLNFNYPKLSHAQTSQYSNYPKFKQEKEDSKTTQEQENLTKELEKQIKELQKLTKEAKELAKKKVTEENKNPKILTKQVASQPKRLRKSNLDNLTLEATQKTNFDKGIRNIIDKLDNLN